MCGGGRLTARGSAQAKKLPSNPLLAEALSSKPGSAADLLVLSPMRRTIETGCMAFGATQLPVALNPDTQVSRGAVAADMHLHRPGIAQASPQASPQVVLTKYRAAQECGDHLNDIGSSPAELKALFADCELAEQLREPLDSLPDGWTAKIGVNAANKKAWTQRFDRFTEWALARTETRMIVVTHYGFVFEALGLRLNNCEVVQCSVSEADGWKVVKRAPGREDGDAEGGANTEEARPFPIGQPPVLQPQGMIGAPYSAGAPEVLTALVPLTVILVVLLAVVFGAGENATAAR